MIVYDERSGELEDQSDKGKRRNKISDLARS
jgi:hypothetical protein